ncbi:MAG: hypothetical protein JSS44_01475 [Proteobacteria bacterium]|nr:hypothetical protein [Pseudomonadota bacterium]
MGRLSSGADPLPAINDIHRKVATMQDGAIQDSAFKLHKILNGSVIALALLTVLEGSALTEWSAMATIFVTLASSAVADVFSQSVANAIACRRRATFSEAWVSLRRHLIIIVPGFLPALAFAAVSADWMPLDTAFAIACWALVLVLFVAGYTASRVGGGRGWRNFLHGLVISAFGLGIVALRMIKPH